MIHLTPSKQSGQQKQHSIGFSGEFSSRPRCFSEVERLKQETGIVAANIVLYVSEGKTWVFPKIGVPQNGWFIIKKLIKMDDLGVPPF